MEVKNHAQHALLVIIAHRGLHRRWFVLLAITVVAHLPHARLHLLDIMLQALGRTLKQHALSDTTAREVLPLAHLVVLATFVLVDQHHQIRRALSALSVDIAPPPTVALLALQVLTALKQAPLV